MALHLLSKSDLYVPVQDPKEVSSMHFVPMHLEPSGVEEVFQRETAGPLGEGFGSDQRCPDIWLPALYHRGSFGGLEVGCGCLTSCI